MGRLHMLAVAILSAWIMSTLCMWFAATQSFGTVDRMMKSPAPQLAQISKPLGEESTRIVLRHAASEINRSLFWGYGVLQIVAGVILCLLVWKRKPRSHIDVGVVTTMLILVVILTAVITPWLVSLGRSIDFLPRNPPPTVMPRFWALHGTFTGLDALKLAAGFILLVRWIVKSKKPESTQASLLPR